MAVHPLATAHVLADVERGLDAIDHAARTGLGDEDRLGLVESARRVARRVEALLATLVGEAEKADSAMKARRTPLPSLLAATATEKKEAPALVRAGRALAELPRVREAALAGSVSMPQARSIERVLGELAPALSDDQRVAAEAALIARVPGRSAEQLAKLGPEVLAEVAPAVVVTRSGRLEARSLRARERRSLSFWEEDGSTHFRGSLPAADAAPLVKLIDAHLEEDRRANRRRDDLRTPEQRRADALVALLAVHQQGRISPSGGGDRPRVVVLLDHQALREGTEGAGVLDTGEELAPGDLRRLCCDAEILPAVLGGASELLDLGRAQRLVSDAQRAALALRDGGCIFPGCDLPSARAQAHHIVPWEVGGPTDLPNLCLLCPTHHSLVEPRGPDGEPAPWQWRVRFNVETKKPECIPPLE